MKTRLVYNRNKKLHQDGTAPVALEVLFQGDKRIINGTGITCTPDAWDNKKRRITDKDPDYFEKNILIQSKLNELNKFLHSYLIIGKPVTSNDIRKFFSPSPTVKTFNDYFKSNLGKSRVKVSIHWDTIQSRRNTLNTLNEYNHSIHFVDVNTEMVNGFIKFLKAKGNAVNTIAKHLKNLRSIIILAQYDGFLKETKKDDPFKGIKIQRIRSEQKFALTFDQVNDIKKLNILPEEGVTYHSWKMFLFSCRTSLRISDVFDLRVKHCRNTENGWVIVKKSVKDSGGTYRINLNQIKDIFGDNMALDILMDYMQSEGDEEKRIFPQFGEEKVSATLEMIAWEIGLQRKLTFHCARHTCATQLAALDVGLHKIMRIGGWNDPRTIKSYIDLADDLLGRF